MKASDLILEPDFLGEIAKKDYVLAGTLYRCNGVIKELGVSSPQVVGIAFALLEERGMLKKFKKNARGIKYGVLHDPINKYLESIMLGKA